MQLCNRILVWKLLFLLLISLPYIQSHMLHYMHLKKFITAVAFARALGKRPTVLPIPIPIPIPIAQNEVIKLPMGGNTPKTTILDGSKGSSQADAIAQLLGGGSSYASQLLGGGGSSYTSQLLGGGGSSYTSQLLGGGGSSYASQLLGGGSTYAGSNKFSYALPSTNNQPSVINLSQLKGSDSNIINTLASVLGNGGQTKVVILGGGQNPGLLGGGSTGMLGASPSVIHLNSVPGSGVMSQSNLMGSGLNYGGMNDFGLNGGLNFGDLGMGSSLSNVFQLPRNTYKSGGNIPSGYNVRGGNGKSPQSSGNSKTCEHCRQPTNNGQRHGHDNFRKAPLSVKFTYRP